MGWLCSLWVPFLSSGPAGQLGHVLPWAMADTHRDDNRETRTGLLLLSKSTYLQEPRQARGSSLFLEAWGVVLPAIVGRF